MEFRWKDNIALKPGDIPDGVTSLTFGYYYNQPILPNVLPQSLISLTFHNSYDPPHKYNQLIHPYALPEATKVEGLNPIELKKIETFRLIKSMWTDKNSWFSTIPKDLQEMVCLYSI